MNVTKSLKRILSVSLIAGLFLFSQKLTAINEFEFDLEFLNELNRIEMNDYAEMQLHQMRKKYPNQQDVINLESAKVYYTIGRSKDAEAALAKISPDSQIANDVLLLKAQVYAARKQWPKAAPIYEKYFHRNPKPSSSSRASQEEFKRAIMIYNHVLKAMNRPKEASQILEKLRFIKDAVEPRQMACLKLQTVIDTEETNYKNGKPINTGALDAALKEAENLQFIRDGVAAEASIQTARTYILLGRDALKQAQEDPEKIAQISYFAKAVTTINTTTPFLIEIEKNMHSKNHSNSPVAEAMFYKAIAFAGHSQVTYAKGNPDKAEKQIKGAAKYLEKMLEDYSNSPLQNQAITEHEACSKLCEKWFDEKLELQSGSGTAALKASLEKADAFLLAKKYAEAYPYCLTAIRAGRISKKMPEAGIRTMMCLAEMNDYYGAEAVLGYMTDIAPSATSTADAALRLGAILMNKSKQEKNPEKKKTLTQRAFSAWDKFVDADPTNPHAPSIAYTIAENAYNTAVKLAQKANQCTKKDDKEAYQNQAKIAFKAAIPKYQRLLDVFSSSDEGIRALYKLGWIYDITESPNKAIDMFQQYYTSEKDLKKYGSDILESKFRAGYLAMNSPHPEDAILHFSELIKRLDKDNNEFEKYSETATRILEDCYAYLPWSYDLQGESFRPELTIAHNHRKRLQKQVDEQNQEIAQNKKERTTIEKEKQKVKEYNTDIKQTLNAMRWDFSALAAEQLKQLAHDTSKMSDAEKQMQKTILAAKIQERAKDLEQQKKNECIGTKITQSKRHTFAIQKEKTLKQKIVKQEEDLKKDKSALETQRNTIAKTKQEIADYNYAVASNQEALVKAEADRQNADDKKMELEAKVTSNKNDADAEKELEIFNRVYEKMQKEYNTILAKNKELNSKKKISAIAEKKAKLQQDSDSIAKSELKVLATASELTITKNKLNENNCNLAAAVKNLALTQIYNAALLKDPTSRDNMLPELQNAKEEAITAENKFSSAKLETLSSQITAIQDHDKLSKQIIDNINKIIQQEKIKNAPQEKEFKHWKDLALLHFELFLKEYPRSKKAPESMARMGTIYLERNDSVKASAILDQLTKDFPNSNAAKNALFIQGQALTEAGQFAKGIKCFQKIQPHFNEVPYGNLVYISDQCLKQNAPEVVISANTEILRRAMHPEHDDYKKITKHAKEKAQFLLALAFQSTKNYTNAIKQAENLLKDNPHTGYFFDAKFLLADVRTHTTPPDWGNAENDIGDILQFTNSSILKNKANCMMGDVMLNSGIPEKRAGALACYQIVAILADPAIPENRPWIEHAIVKSARIYADDKNTEKLQKMADLYNKFFSGGKHRAELQKLLP